MTAPPPAPRVELALRQATEFFAAELANPGSQAPQWTEFEWRMARAAAALHGVTPLLAGVVRWRGPREWESFVGQQWNHAAVRHRRIAALLARMDEQARRADVVIVPLKEAALLRRGMYSAGTRPVADLDLLVPECAGARMPQLLHALGYLDTSVSWKHRVFEPAEYAFSLGRKGAAGFAERADRPIRIDLHTSIDERLPLMAADVSELVYPPAPHPGLNGYPSSVAMLVHLLLHAAGSMLRRALRLIQLHDLALLSARMREADWAQLLACRVDHRALWWAVPPLEMVARYYPQAIPSAVLAALARCCPRTLRGVARRRTISEVCLARLRADAREMHGGHNALSVAGR